MKRCCIRWNKKKWAGKKALILLLFVCLFLTGCQGAQKEEKKNSIRIGISLYRGDDTFINNIRNELEDLETDALLCNDGTDDDLDWEADDDDFSWDSDDDDDWDDDNDKDDW